MAQSGTLRKGWWWVFGYSQLQGVCLEVLRIGGCLLWDHCHMDSLGLEDTGQPLAKRYVKWRSILPDPGIPGEWKRVERQG